MKTKFVMKLFLLLFMIFPSFAFAQTIYVDCENWNDNLTTVSGWETYKTINKVLEKVYVDSNGKTLQNYEIVVDGAITTCEYWQIQLWGSKTVRGTNNVLTIKAKDVNKRYKINGPSWDYAIMVRDSDNTNKITILNANISWSWERGMIYTWTQGDNYYNLTIKDSQFNVWKTICLDQSYCTFELSNSFIVINQIKWDQMRFPAYTHNNLVEVNQIYNKANRFLMAHNDVTYSWKMGIIDNEINLYMDLSDGDSASKNYHLLSALWLPGNHQAIFMGNTVNYKGPWTAIFNVLFHADRNTDSNFRQRRNRTFFVNNKFNWISKIKAYPIGYSREWYGSSEKNFWFINNTFDSNLVVSSYSQDLGIRWNYSVIEGLNNLNFFPYGTSSTYGRNNTVNQNNGYRVVIDLNRDNVITENEKVSDKYCVTTDNCNKEQFTLFF